MRLHFLPPYSMILLHGLNSICYLNSKLAAVRILSQSVFKSFSVKTSALRNAQQAVPSGKCVFSVSSIAANQGLTLDGEKSKRYPSLAGPGQAETDAQQ